MNILKRKLVNKGELDNCPLCGGNTQFHQDAVSGDINQHALIKCRGKCKTLFHVLSEINIKKHKKKGLQKMAIKIFNNREYKTIISDNKPA